jgi:osmoprotectant transport system substrate-binding protein
MADWAAYLNKGSAVKVVGSQEFFTSAAAMPAFEAAYGFKLKKGEMIALATGDTAVTEKAAAQGTDGANAAMAYGTDGTISALDLVVLSDPLGAQPIYQPAPTVRKDIADKYPELATALNPVFERLTLETLQKLNGQVAVEGKDPKTVATDWLRSEGFIK